MATFSSDKVATNLPTRFVHSGLYTEFATYSGSASFSNGDVVQMVKVPAGARVVGFTLQSNTIEAEGSGSASGVVIDVGDGLDNDRYVHSASSSALMILGPYPSLGAPADGSINPAAIGYEYSADDTVDITVQTVPSAQTSNPIFRMFVTMMVDN